MRVGEFCFVVFNLIFLDVYFGWLVLLIFYDEFFNWDLSNVIVVVLFSLIGLSVLSIGIFGEYMS